MLDCFSRYTWGQLYTSKLPLTAVQVMNNDVLPFFDEHRVRVKTVLSDNGREFCGRPDRHPYELFLQLEDIEHRTTKVGRPQSEPPGTRPSRRCRPLWPATRAGVASDITDSLVRGKLT